MDSLDIQDFDDGSEDYSTPEDVLKKLTSSLQNELCAPCLLPTEMNLVDVLLDQIQGMETNINDQADRTQSRISTHRVELQRISYVTSEYIRCRLRKIERNPNEVIGEHEKRVGEGRADLLSDNELQFAKEYAATEADLFDKEVLEFLPAALKKVCVPKTDHLVDFVYAQVLEDDIGNVSIPDWTDLNSEVILEMDKSSVHLIPFASVKHCVEEEKIRLL